MTMQYVEVNKIIVTSIATLLNTRRYQTLAVKKSQNSLRLSIEHGNNIVDIYSHSKFCDVMQFLTLPLYQRLHIVV